MNVEGPKPAQTGIDGVIVCVRSTYFASRSVSSYSLHSEGERVCEWEWAPATPALTIVAATTHTTARVRRPTRCLRLLIMVLPASMGTGREQHRRATRARQARRRRGGSRTPFRLPGEIALDDESPRRPGAFVSSVRVRLRVQKPVEEVA